MKLISLNIWGGRMLTPLIDFIEKHKKDVDVFCFQEVRNGPLAYGVVDNDEIENIYEKLKLFFEGFNGYYSEQIPGVGSATFVRKNIDVHEVKKETILSFEELSHIKRRDGFSYYPRIMQIIKIDKYAIYNFHGIPGGQKKDTLERDLQNKRIINILQSEKVPKILVGDFNIDTNTNVILELSDILDNLIAKNNIKKTRNHYYKEIESLPISDYAFVSGEIEVKNFEVLEDEVSDHLPLLLEFN